MISGSNGFWAFSGIPFIEPRNFTTMFEHLKNMGDLTGNPTKSIEIYSLDKMKVRHYQPFGKGRPTLLVYALINGLYILDLSKDTSFIHGLIEEEMDLYAIDWGEPTAEDRYLDLEDFIDYVNDAVDAIREQTGYDKINFVLECQGGTIGLIYAALYPEKIHQIVAISTPVDFSYYSLPFQLSRNIDVDTFIDALGMIPGNIMNSTFLFLYPFDAMIGRYWEFFEKGADPQFMKDFFRVENWFYNAPPLVGEFFRTWLKNLCTDNELYRDQLYIYNRKVELSRICCPILVICGKEDNIVPPLSSQALREKVGSVEYEEKIYDQNHYTMMATPFTHDVLAKEVAAFLQKKEERR